MCHCINKLVLIIVNIVFLLAGAAVVGVSIWVIVSKDSLFQLVHVATQGANIDDATLANYEKSTSTLLAAAYVVLAFGALSFVIGFCGCCGAVKESTCLLMIYASAITIVLIVEIAGGIAAGVFKHRIDKELRPTLVQLERDKFVPLNVVVGNKSSPNAVFSALVNYAQVALECFGVSSMQDIVGPTTLWSNSSREFNGRNLTVPATCCKMKDQEELLKKQNWSSIANYLDDGNCPYGPVDSGNINKVGCYDKLNSYVDKYSIAIIIVGILVGMFEIICVIMACSMIQKLRSEKQNV